MATDLWDWSLVSVALLTKDVICKELRGIELSIALHGVSVLEEWACFPPFSMFVKPEWDC